MAMFARPFVSASPAASALQFGWAAQQTRNAASLKSLKARMRSFENMKKITKSMKMVAASKLKGDERRMIAALPFTKPVQDLFARLPFEEKSGTLTYFGMTSDKGLCGGVNNAVAKFVRRGIAEEEAKGNTAKYMGTGNKGVAAMKRLLGDRFTFTFDELAKVPWTYGTASIIAEQIIASNPNRMKVVSNKFRSLVAYETQSVPLMTISEAMTMDRAEFSKAMDVYSFEPSIYEVWNDLHEFYYSAVIHGNFLQGAVCEQSSRMAAMESASKNANEMLDKVSLVYNRARQAKITTELCEIISGASAV